MDPLTTAAASGIQARVDSLDMVANNMANGSTTGFKVDREFYSTFTGAASSAGVDPSVGDNPVIEKCWTDYAQGTLLPTGSSTDLALSGKGFFSVSGPNGPLYTRNGNFQVSSTGVLATAEGYPVRQIGGQAIQLSASGAISVSPQGEVSQNGQTLGRLELDTFADPSQLTKAASTYFENPNPKVIEPIVAADVQVLQGKLESSNSSPTESAARMVTLLRQFEMLQHAVKIGADMNKQAIEEVARVTA